MLIDTHAHLQSDDFRADLSDVMRRAREAGVRRVVVVGTDLQDSAEAVRMAGAYEEIVASVGIHPSEAHRVPVSPILTQLEALTRQPGVVAVGEIGLDFYRHEATASEQQELLEAQLETASRAQLPVIVHSRRALERLWDILVTWRGRIPGGVMHCFPGSVEQAGRFVEMGFMLGIGGTATFPKSRVPEVLKHVGLDNVVLETDCPYLAPVPRRGKRNEPAYVRFVADRVASEVDVTTSVVEELTTRNAVRLFGLPEVEAPTG